MREQLFDQLGMTQASYLWKEEFESLAADGHSSDGTFSRDIVKLTAEYAEGGILINIIELSKFLKHTLTEYQSGSLVLNTMTIPAVQVSDHGGNGSMWRGLGWAVELTPQGQSIWHGGSNGAFKAFLFLDLEQETGLAYLANGSNGLTIIPEIIDTLFGEHHIFQEYYASQ
jgi:CubicO group peptidase (beta-lactamase class C family)